jgi:hypothetical protein
MGESIHKARLAVVIGAGALFCGAVAYSQTAAQRSSTAAPLAKTTAAATKLLPRFPDFGHLPPPSDYQSRIFKLSQDFPKSKPEMEPEVKQILAIDYTKDWKKYMTAVRDYIYAGNIEADGVANDFYLEDNKVRRWFHVPWQHYGDFGREGIHGLTKEGPVNPFVLGQRQPNLWQTYAVGFYNAPGGYMIGKTWADADNPDVSVMQAEGFPVGTVVGKVLFTTAPVAEVPWLTNPIEWLAYTTKSFDPSSPRMMNTVRFVQMDIMVRDERAKETGGWVFGTFTYNGALAKPNLWDNVVPVGLMWGNDPTVAYADSASNPAPTKTLINPLLKQTIINTSAELPPMHLGYGLRLNGPVDNTKSSCMSCHSTAQFPAISPILPFFASQDGKALKPADKEWMRWFRNVPCKTPFDKQATSTDYSLQLAASIQNFLTAQSAYNGGLYNVQYWNGLPVNQIRGSRGLERGQVKTLAKGAVK